MYVGKKYVFTRLLYCSSGIAILLVNSLSIIYKVGHPKEDLRFKKIYV